MLFITRSFVILYCLFRYRLFFLLSFIPGFSIFRVFLDTNSQRQAARLRAGLQFLGPIFVKLGQILAVRSDIIGDTFAKALEGLLEDGTFVHFCRVKPYLEVAFGTPYAQQLLNLHNLSLNELLQNPALHLKPIAAGSIAQVYRLKLSEHKILAIKVVKPGLRRRFARELRFLETLFNLAERRLREANRAKISKLIKEVKRVSAFELDLKFEGAAIAQMQDNLKDYPHLVKMPKVYWEFSTKDVLVTEWLNGVKLMDYPIALSEDEGAQVAKNLLFLFFLQVGVHGFFHGDLHPGNILILPGNVIGLIDLGIVGTLSIVVQNQVLRVWKAFLNQDYQEAANIHFSAGWVLDSYNRRDLELAIRSIVDPIFSNADKHNISIASLIGQLMEVTRMFGMEMQQQLVLVQKNMLLVEGIIHKLTSHNIWDLSREVINKDEFKVSSAQQAKVVATFAKDNATEMLSLFKQKLRIESSPHRNLILRERWFGRCIICAIMGAALVLLVERLWLQ